MPANKDLRNDANQDNLLRFLDCSVIRHLHSINESEENGDLQRFDTVRGLFVEGEPAYPGGQFFNKTHTQVAVRSIYCTVRSTSRRESVGLSEEARTSIRTKLYYLREAIEKSDYDVRAKARLRARLDEFEKDLKKRRINYVAVARFAIEVIALPGALSSSYDITAKLVNQIIQTIGEEKISEDERRRLPPVEKPAALIPPRAEEKKKSEPDFGRAFSRDLDDEIPF